MALNRFVVPAFALILGAAGIGPIQPAALAQGPPPPPPPGFAPPDRGGWDAPPPDFRDVQRRGFHDGIEGAHRDFENHRRPDVNNRVEFRHPPVPRPDRDAYRDGFRHGYDVAVSHMMGDHGPGPGHGFDHDHDHY